MSLILIPVSITKKQNTVDFFCFSSYHDCFFYHLFPLTGQEFDVKAKCVINATGPFTDSLRKMDNQETQNICQPSAGVHIVIPGYYRYTLRVYPLKWFFGISNA